jgi:hypothetical protein
MISDISQDAAAYSACYNMEATACPAPCKVYDPTHIECHAPADMPAPMCQYPTTTSAAGADVTSAWSTKSCTFECPSGSNFKPQPMFTYPFCHPQTSEVSDKARWEYCNPTKLGTACPTDCAFNNFAQLIPENNDFCAIAYINPDIDAIMGCGGKQEQ